MNDKEMRVLIEKLVKSNKTLVDEIATLKAQLQNIQSDFAVYKNMQRSGP